MAGIHADRGDKSHRLISGEVPTVGMRVINNNLDECTITKVSTEGDCGWYCEAWHETDKGIFNCERLTTRMPR
jgi:hypothetical protein